LSEKAATPDCERTKIPRAMAFLVLEQPEELGDDELDVELTLVASLRGRLRFDRFQELLDEAQLRGLVRQKEDDPWQAAPS